MARAEAAVIRAFHARGFNCIKTSAYRPPATVSGGEKTLHDEGLAADYDTDHEIHAGIWTALKEEIQGEVGEEYQVLAHDKGSGMHIHTEYDPAWRN